MISRIIYLKHSLLIFLLLFSTENIADIDLQKQANNSTNFAISNTGNYKITHNIAADEITIINTKDNRIIKTIRTRSKQGDHYKISAMYNIPPRHSFIIAFSNAQEIWEIPYSSEGGVDVYKGWAHDYRKDSGEGKIESWQLDLNKKSDQFPVRRIKIHHYFSKLFFDHDFINVIGTSGKSDDGIVINLDTKKKVTTLNKKLMPKLYPVFTWDYKGNSVFITSNNVNTIKHSTQKKSFSIVDIESGRVIKSIPISKQIIAIKGNKNTDFIYFKMRGVNNKTQWKQLDKKSLTLNLTIK
ncbi:MAG: hypothetical protein OCD00_05665 [Colwellia sp.]